MEETAKIKKRKIREEREIIRREKELSKPKGPGYLIYHMSKKTPSYRR